MAINASILFCEDIREELGGKQSYIGVLGSDIEVTAFPATIRQLCMVGSAVVEGEAEVQISGMLVCSDPEISLPPPFETVTRSPAGTETWDIRLNLQMGMIVLQAPCEIIAHINFGDITAYRRLKISLGSGDDGSVISPMQSG